MPTCDTCKNRFDESVKVCPVDGTALGLDDPLVGRVLGDRYRVLSRIAEGGMGTVYRVEHVVLGRRMAVKVLRPEFSTDEDLVRRFQREAVAASRIGQENIVDVTDFGRTREGNLYFVMEELNGKSLGTVLSEEGALGPERTVRILAQVCRALAAAHAHAIIHRDLKPENVLVMRRDDGSDFIKVVDFGISKSAGGVGEERITRAGTIIGTPEYMAPEQGAARAVDQRADVYALGILAYELLTSTVPFQGATAIATLIKHQTEPPDPPSKRRAGIPPALERLILKALSKKPSQRQQNMVEVAAELDDVLALYKLPPVYERGRTPAPLPAAIPGRTVLFRPLGRTPRGATETIDDPPAERLPPPSGHLEMLDGMPVAEAKRRAGRRLVVGALALAALAAVATWAVLAQPRRPPAAAAQPPAPAPFPIALPPSEPPPQLAVQKQEPVSEVPVPIPAAPPAPRPAPARRPPAVKVVRPAARPPPPRKETGVRRPTDENPYDKIDDLKPAPF